MPPDAIVLSEDVAQRASSVLLASVDRSTSRAGTERSASTSLHPEHAQDILYPGNAGGIEP